MQITIIILSAIGSIIALFGDTYNKEKKKLNILGYISGIIILTSLIMITSLQWGKNNSSDKKLKYALESLTDNLCNQSMILKIALSNSDNINYSVLNNLYPPLVDDFEKTFTRYQDNLPLELFEISQITLDEQNEIKLITSSNETQNSSDSLINSETDFNFQILNQIMKDRFSNVLEKNNNLKELMINELIKLSDEKAEEIRKYNSCNFE